VTTVTPTVGLASRHQVVRDFVGYFPRLLKWQVPVTAAALGVALLLWKQSGVESTTNAVWLLRAVVVVMTAGSIFLLDDASANMSEPVATPLRFRTGVRLAAMTAAIAVGYVPAIALVAGRALIRGAWFGVLIEAATFATVAVAVSLWLQRRRGVAEPGQYGAMSVVLTFLAAHAVGARWPMLALPSSDWTAAHWRWAALLLVAGAAILVNLRDPAAAPWRSALRRG